MSYQDLQKMDQGSYFRLLESEGNYVLDYPEYGFPFLAESSGHDRIHIAQDEKNMLKRLLESPIPAVSTFTDDKDAKTHIANAVVYHALDITTWFFKEPSEFKTAEEFRRLEITLDMRETVGEGITRNLDKVETSAITVVLDRDFRPDSEYGITLTTAFPELVKRPECTKVTGHINAIETVNENKIFQDDIQRLVFLTKARFPEADCYYEPEKDGKEPRLICKHQKGDETTRISIGKDNLWIRVFSVNSKPMTFREHAFRYPAQTKVLAQIITDRDRLNKNMPVLQNTVKQSRSAERSEESEQTRGR